MATIILDTRHHRPTKSWIISAEVGEDSEDTAETEYVVSLVEDLNEGASTKAGAKRLMETLAEDFITEPGVDEVSLYVEADFWKSYRR